MEILVAEKNIAPTTKKENKMTTAEKNLTVEKDIEVYRDRPDGTMIHIRNNELRQFLQNYCVGSDIIPYYHIYDESETDAEKRSKDRKSVYSIVTLIAQYENINRRKSHAREENLKKSFNELVKVLLEEKKTLEKETKEAFASDSITFEQVANGLELDTIIVVRDRDQLVAMKVSETRMINSMFGSYVKISGKVYCWNGTGLTVGKHTFYVDSYVGKKSLAQIGITTIDEVRDELLARGRKYVSLNEKPFYGMYEGNIVRRYWQGDAKFAANGRLMIDASSMASVDPNYSKYFGGVSPNDEDDNDYGQRNEKISLENLTDEILICTPPVLYGFSFSSKVWGEVQVNGVTNVNFRADAWDKLVLNTDVKDTIRTLTEADSLNSKDFIDSKGGGAIFLLSGNPGCGKTLTAEAVAELLQRPLYSVGIGELGVNVGELEESLTRILDIAHRWRAVLLLDEADIFLETRTDHDIERNAMVAVFLRRLEYYQGILFLTSNRAKKIDPAFLSRISLALAYEDLDSDSRVKVWNGILKLHAADSFELSAADIKSLAHEDLNGREIKNIVRITLTLARQKGYVAKLENFEKSVKMTQAFKKAD